MREIKFRAWDHREGKMWVPIIDKDGAPCAKHFITNQLVRMTGELLDPIMQYTGIDDKNGVEIYEGDILREGGSFGAANTGSVRFDWGRFYWLGGEEWGEIDEDRVEVIGNIYENPDLMESP